MTVLGDEGTHDYEPLSISSNLKYKKRSDLDSSEPIDEIGEMMRKRMMSSDRMNHLFRDRRAHFNGLFNTLSKRYQKKGAVAPWVRKYLLDHETGKNNYF